MLLGGARVCSGPSLQLAAALVEIHHAWHAPCPLRRHAAPVCPMRPPTSNARSCRATPALQGAGIVWPTKIGKLELNLCQVLARQPFDQPRVGLQFGFMPPAW